MDPMDDMAVLSKSIEPAVLGGRIRRARLAAGLTQAELASGVASTAYVSRIEAGQRRPDLKLLRALAERLDATPEELLIGVSRARRAELQLALDYAELALVSGDSAEALTSAQHLLADAFDVDAPDIILGARRIHALAMEASGRFDQAIDELEQLVDDEAAAEGPPQLQIALCRCYRESGDLASAVEIGERSLHQLTERGLLGVDDTVQLTVTLAAAYFERGDTSRAIRLCRQAITAAEKTGTPLAKGSAYWNASVMESKEGDADTALALARKALGHLTSASDGRNLGRLRTQLGILQLRTDPPLPQEALETLTMARREMDWASASPADKADNQLAQGRASFLMGATAEAADQAEQALQLAGPDLPFVVADARVLQGQVAASAGDLRGAVAAYQEAVATLTAVGSDRRAAQLWFDLGEVWDALGRQEEARDAYRRAAASTGLQQSRGGELVQPPTSATEA